MHTRRTNIIDVNCCHHIVKSRERFGPQICSTEDRWCFPIIRKRERKSKLTGMDKYLATEEEGMKREPSEGQDSRMGYTLKTIMIIGRFMLFQHF